MKSLGCVSEVSRYEDVEGSKSLSRWEIREKFKPLGGLETDVGRETGFKNCVPGGSHPWRYRSNKYPVLWIKNLLRNIVSFFPDN